MNKVEQIKKNELSEIADFLIFIEDYGHIFYESEHVLDSGFNKILEGIEEIKKIIDRNYGF